MANRERGEVDLAFGDERYTLRMSINAVAEIETYLDLGVNDIAAMVRDAKSFRIGTWRMLLWGALQEFHGCSIEEAGEIMGRAGVDVTVDTVGEAMKLAFPENNKGTGKNPPKASRRAGARSAGNGASRPAAPVNSSGRASPAK